MSDKEEIELDGFVFEYEITHHGYPAHNNCRTDDAYPGEGPDFEVSDDIVDDEGAKSKWSHVATEWCCSIEQAEAAVNEAITVEISK
jgi:hypothetical protein